MYFGPPNLSAPEAMPAGLRFWLESR